MRVCVGMCGYVLLYFMCMLLCCQQTELIVREDCCTVCHRSGELLMCDVCSLVYHLQCLDPPLVTVPQGFWSCLKCQVSV